MFLPSNIAIFATFAPPKNHVFPYLHVKGYIKMIATPISFLLYTLFCIEVINTIEANTFSLLFFLCLAQLLAILHRVT